MTDKTPNDTHVVSHETAPRDPQQVLPSTGEPQIDTGAEAVGALADAHCDRLGSTSVPVWEGMLAAADPMLTAVVIEMREALAECSDDLEQYVNAAWPPSVRAYPDNARKHERDMAPVIRARAALQKDRTP